MGSGKRSSGHAAQEKAIFAVFLRAHRLLADTVVRIDQPEAEFPDIIAGMADGTEVDFELAEWVDGNQMAAAKRRERLEQEILSAIGPQGINTSRVFRAVMLSSRENSPDFDSADAAAFKSEFFFLCKETENLWPAQLGWHSPAGHHCQDLPERPTLGKYLDAIHFDPRVVGGVERSWPAGAPWAFWRAGDSYSPDTVLEALADILVKKVVRYGRSARSTQLLIYYGRAWAYNTPYYGNDTREFADVARKAMRVVQNQATFEKIYLLSALTPGLEVFEIFPRLARLD